MTRPRKELKTVADIKADPDFRIVFGPATYKSFLDILAVGKEFHFNPAALSRNIILIWIRRFINCNDKQLKDKMITEVLQSMHGMNQVDLFEKWENIEAEAKPPLNNPKVLVKKKSTRQIGRESIYGKMKKRSKK